VRDESPHKEDEEKEDTETAKQQRGGHHLATDADTDTAPTETAPVKKQ
jgi:hypothetical protein